MSPKPVIPREQAKRDVEAAVAFYLDELAEQAALDLVDALQDAYAQIGHHPGMGSLRHAHELDLPGLRTWSTARFPYLICYVEREDHVDVWRVLNNRWDIPELMREPGE